ncbi:MAG: GNAT family N-acetyltransferase [Negativicutes bacterium]|nr:GNAT family N-acetyltransferase [Negativicutes bacterium]
MRSARPGDLTSIEKLLTSSGLVAVEVATGLDRFLVADQAGIVGVLGRESTSQAVLLRSLAVASEVRKAGVAEALMNEALAQAKAAESAVAYLFTNTAADYFTKRGFQSIERMEVPAAFLNSPAVSTCCSTATAMQMELK